MNEIIENAFLSSPAGYPEPVTHLQSLIQLELSNKKNKWYLEGLVKSESN